CVGCRTDRCLTSNKLQSLCFSDGSLLGSDQPHRRLQTPPSRVRATVTMTKRIKPAELGFHMPAEWHQHAATWLTWPKDPITWPERVPQVEEIYLRMIE